MNEQQLRWLIEDYQENPGNYSPEEARQIQAAMQQMGGGGEQFSGNGGFLGQLLYHALDSALLGILPNKQPVTESEATGASLGSMLGSYIPILLGSRLMTGKLSGPTKAFEKALETSKKTDIAFKKAFGDNLGEKLYKYESLAKWLMTNPELKEQVIGGALGGTVSDLFDNGPNIMGGLIGGLYPYILKGVTKYKYAKAPLDTKTSSAPSHEKTTPTTKSTTKSTPSNTTGEKNIDDLIAKAEEAAELGLTRNFKYKTK